MNRIVHSVAVLVVTFPLMSFSQGLPVRQMDYIDVNNISMWFTMNGTTSRDPQTGRAGFEYPKGSGKHPIFCEGLVWSGEINGTIHAGGSSYRYGLQPGKVLPNGEAEYPHDVSVRILKAKQLTPASYQSLSQSEQERLRSNYNDWPTDDGAPWVDVDQNGVYEPDFDGWVAGDRTSDHPSFKGDEVFWWVSNDLDSVHTLWLYGTLPMRIELQTTVWAFNEPGILENTVFMKYKLINRNTDTIRNAYLGKWADLDVGFYYTNFVGVNTGCNMAYAYNSEPYDSVYEARPPAVGHVLLQGPIVEDSGSIAFFDIGERLHYKNLPVSSFAHYISGNAVYSHPTLGSPHGAVMLHKNMQCKLRNGRPYTDPITGLDACPPLSGNPLTNNGWIDGIIDSPGPRQYLVSAGPFDFAPGDTQEIVFAATVAQGNDNMHSLALLFEQACELQSLYPERLVVSTPRLQAQAHSLEVSPAYPNPVSDQATLRYSLPATGNVTVTLTNVLGEHVRTHYLGRVEAGRHTADIQTAGLMPGVYLVTLRTGTQRSTQRIVVR